MSAPLINLEKYRIILASGSPRRKELLKGLGIIFDVVVDKDLDETFPDSMPVTDVANYLAQKKASHYMEQIKDNQLFITADTVVISENTILNKPVHRNEAIGMLQSLSGRTHQVETGVCISTIKKQIVFKSTSDVTFCQLSQNEIEFYVDNYRPFDKAGSYGIQEWIGFVGVEKIQGSYFNVMGLPVQKLYQELKKF